MREEGGRRGHLLPCCSAPCPGTQAPGPSENPAVVTGAEPTVAAVKTGFSAEKNPKKDINTRILLKKWPQKSRRNSPLSPWTWGPFNN